MKLFSVIGFFDNGVIWENDKEVWTTAENAEEAAEKVVRFYNAQYDTVFNPRTIDEVDGENLIFNSIAKS